MARQNIDILHSAVYAKDISKHVVSTDIYICLWTRWKLDRYQTLYVVHCAQVWNVKQLKTISSSQWSMIIIIQLAFSHSFVLSFSHFALLLVAMSLFVTRHAKLLFFYHFLWSVRIIKHIMRCDFVDKQYETQLKDKKLLKYYIKIYLIYNKLAVTATCSRKIYCFAFGFMVSLNTWDRAC